MKFFNRILEQADNETVAYNEIKPLEDDLREAIRRFYTRNRMSPKRAYVPFVMYEHFLTWRMKMGMYHSCIYMGVELLPHDCEKIIITAGIVK